MKAAFFFSILCLSACDRVKDTFGLNHHQPDEFQVSTNPPLTIPRDYKLRPPTDPSKPSIPGTSEPIRPGTAESVFVKKITEENDPDIRQKVDTEAEQTILSKKIDEIKKNAGSLTSSETHE